MSALSDIRALNFSWRYPVITQLCHHFFIKHHTRRVKFVLAWSRCLNRSESYFWGSFMERVNLNVYAEQKPSSSSFAIHCSRTMLNKCFSLNVSANKSDYTGLILFIIIVSHFNNPSASITKELTCRTLLLFVGCEIFFIFIILINNFCKWPRSTIKLFSCLGSTETH